MIAASQLPNVTKVESHASDTPCCNCGSLQQLYLIGLWGGGHYAKSVCGNCERFLKWIPNPSKPPKRKNPKKLLERNSKGFCELCLRISDALPLPQVLEAHHIIPVELGGTDDDDNIQVVCTSCHRLIHHQRTYLGHSAVKISASDNITKS